MCKNKRVVGVLPFKPQPNLIVIVRQRIFAKSVQLPDECRVFLTYEYLLWAKYYAVCSVTITIYAEKQEKKGGGRMVNL